MKKEEIEKLSIALEEAKDTFDIIIGKMKANGINYPYESVQYVVDGNYGRTKMDIYGLSDMKYVHDTIREENKSGLRKLKARTVINHVAWFTLVYGGGFVGRILFSNVDGIELTKEQEMLYLSHVVGASAAALGISLVGYGLLHNAQTKNPDILDVPGELSIIKQDFKDNSAQIVKDIKMIQSINSELWNILEQTRSSRLSRGL